MKKICIVEDMALLRDALATTINAQSDMKVVAAIVNADETLAVCRKFAPDLALIDVVTEGKNNGLVAAAALRQALPDIKVVIMTSLPEITFVETARKAGAHSFVYKNSDSRYLLHVLRSTLSGKGIYPGPGDAIIARTKFADVEIEIMRLVCQGKSRSEMAAALNFSESKVKALVTGILNKTGFKNILKFSVYAVAHGFIVPDEGER